MIRFPDAVQSLTATLGEKIGIANVLVEPGAMAAYLVEERGHFRGSAIAVVRPGSMEEVAFAVRTCAAAGIPIVPLGGNTGLVGGGVPLGGVVLSLARLDRIRDVDRFNATMTVEAGCILKTIQDAAEAADCLFPLSLASEGSSTIGGNLATNAGGIAVLRYGNARELVLGLEVVLADGRVWNGLTRLRKDNAGYDLRDLFIGSEGTLGIITAAVLKLFPRPRTRTVAMAGCATPREALLLLERLRRTVGDQLIAFEYMPRFALDMVLRHAPGTVRPLAGEHAAYVLMELTSPDPEMNLRDRLEQSLGAALEDGLIEDATIGASEAQNAALWKLRDSLSEVQKFEGGSIKHDIAVPVSRVADFIDEATRACEAALAGIRVCAFGHFGDGNIHFNLSQPVGMEKAAFLAQWERFNRIVHDIVHAMDGSIAAEHGVGLLKRDELTHYKDPVALDLMRTLKRSLDPNNILNPGKILALAEDLPSALPIVDVA